MKMRKLFAGIAAAATLLGGMALGAASAQADGTVVDSTATFTFTADKAEQLTNRQLSFYKIAITSSMVLTDTVFRPTRLTRPKWMLHWERR